MGGGGTMRSAAAKVFGLGILNTGLRGSQAEIPFSTAVRQGTRPVSAVISSSDDLKLAPPQDATDDASKQRPYWGMDDWDFTGGGGSDEELMMRSGETMPRLVFGGVPTLQETEEATSELKYVLDNAYLSPKSPKSDLDAKACVVSESTVAAPVPKTAIHAFRFLSQSPAAQTVVASIACDPKVWNAVLENEAVMRFLQSREMSIPKSAPSDAESETHESPNPFGKSENWFTDCLEKVKVTVTEMMSSLSDYFQNFFSNVYEHVSPDGSGKASLVDKTMGASLMGLAIMVIMVVVLKRS